MSEAGFYKAIIECRFQQVKYFLENGARLLRRGYTGNVLLAALQIEDENKRRKMFNLLLRRGANYWDVDTDTDRDTFLWACHLDRTAQVIKLLHFAPGGIDLCRLDKAGYSGLHYAAMKGNLTLVEVLVNSLVKYGLSVDIEDRSGLTPHMHAKKLAFNEIAALLEKKGNASTQRFHENFVKTLIKTQQTGQAGTKNGTRTTKGFDYPIRCPTDFDERGLYKSDTSMNLEYVTGGPSSPTHRLSYSSPPPISKKSVEKLQTLFNYQGYKRDDGAASNDRAKNEESVRNSNLESMMQILSEQLCVSYRDPAVKDIRDSLVPGSYHGKRRVSTLAIILAKVTAKTGENEKRKRLANHLNKYGNNLKKSKNSQMTFIKDGLVRREEGAAANRKLTENRLKLPAIEDR